MIVDINSKSQPMKRTCYNKHHPWRQPMNITDSCVKEATPKPSEFLCKFNGLADIEVAPERPEKLMLSYMKLMFVHQICKFQND